MSRHSVSRYPLHCRRCMLWLPEADYEILVSRLPDYEVKHD